VSLDASNQISECTHSIRNLLDGLNIIARNELVIRVEELQTSLLKCPLCQEQTLDTRKTFVWIVISLFDQSQFFTLRLVQTTLDGISLLQLLESQYKQLRVVLIRKGSVTPMR
jgi:hypothetical protein